MLPKQSAPTLSGAGGGDSEEPVLKRKPHDIN